ncbi:hypothetical protein OH77DRAFT_951425 [Trametes cingulata]|nr:hypothetical protein OH77DRAFT_951425 [Trametes cingulata]
MPPQLVQGLRMRPVCYPSRRVAQGICYKQESSQKDDTVAATGSVAPPLAGVASPDYYGGWRGIHVSPALNNALRCCYRIGSSSSCVGGSPCATRCGRSPVLHTRYCLSIRRRDRKVLP